MSREEALEILKNDTVDTSDDWCEALDIAIKALEQEPCEDCISRQAAIDLADELKDDLPDDDHLSDMVMSHNEGILEYQTKLSLLPPVTPTEKVGHWEWGQYDGNPNIGNWHCSECNRIVCGAITAVNPVYSYKYCPECGTKMREVEK